MIALGACGSGGSSDPSSSVSAMTAEASDGPTTQAKKGKNRVPVAEFTATLVSHLCHGNRQTGNGSQADTFRFDPTSSFVPAKKATYTWDFRDGSTPTVQKGSPTIIEHTFSSSGFAACRHYLQDVSLSITGKGHAVSSKTVTIRIGTNRPPNANVSMTPTPAAGIAPYAVNFDASQSRDDVAIASYSWDFGDGTPPANRVAPQHTFSATSDGAIYKTHVTVTDDEGASSTSRDLEIRVAPPRGSLVLSGTLQVPAPSAVDRDVNDPSTTATSNDDFDHAQPIPNPVTVGGYVVQPGWGFPGNVQVAGDVEDFYAVTLAAADAVRLSVPSNVAATLPIRIYDSNRDLVDASEVQSGGVESVTLMAPGAGSYFIEIGSDFAGTNYVLEVGPAASIAATYLAIASSEQSTAVTPLLAGTAPIGVQHLIVVHPLTGITIARLLLDGINDQYHFSIPNMGPGSYRIYSGTDHNADGFTCDGGEACGAYPTLAEPADIVVSGNTDVAFPVVFHLESNGTFSIASASASATGTAPSSATPIRKSQ